MRYLLLALTFVTITLGTAVPCRAAALEARIDISSQTMTVRRHGKVIHSWKVSTARKGYVTPRGSWRPTRLHRMWHSRKYDMTPMPWSLHSGSISRSSSRYSRL